jgi:RNA polymerase sigma factor (sigma-70 family)
MHGDGSGSDLTLGEQPLAQVISQFTDLKDEPARSAAAAEILRRFEPLLRRYFNQIREPAIGYEDFVQDVMVRLLIVLPRLRDVQSFPGLMRKIVIGTMADALRKRPRGRVELDLQSWERELATTFDESISTELVLRSCLEQLPRGPGRRILELHLEGRSVSDTASELRMKEATVRMHKSRSIKSLRKILGN